MSKALVFLIIMCRRIGEYISLELFCFVNLISSCSLTPWRLTSTETIRLIRDGENGGGGGGDRERKIMYLSLHCHHQNDSSIKMGSDESLFNV